MRKSSEIFPYSTLEYIFGVCRFNSSYYLLQTFIQMHAHILYTMKTTIHAEPNFYDFHCQVLFIQTIYKLDESYAFLNMGGVRSRKYCAISDMTTTWGLRREVVLRINLSRASIEAWRML